MWHLKYVTSYIILLTFLDTAVSDTYKYLIKYSEHLFYSLLSPFCAPPGNLVTELGHTIFTEPDGFLGSRDHGGFLYIRPSFQCLTNTLTWLKSFVCCLSRSCSGSIKSEIDGRAMDGVPSVKIHAGTDYIGQGYVIRWTEVFIIQVREIMGWRPW